MKTCEICDPVDFMVVWDWTENDWVKHYETHEEKEALDDSA